MATRSLPATSQLLNCVGTCHNSQPLRYMSITHSDTAQLATSTCTLERTHRVAGRLLQGMSPLGSLPPPSLGVHYCTFFSMKGLARTRINVLTSSLHSPSLLTCPGRCPSSRRDQRPALHPRIEEVRSPLFPLRRVHGCVSR